MALVVVLALDAIHCATMILVVNKTTAGSRKSMRRHRLKTKPEGQSLA
jgi:hypothetical protein